ncbi:MAG: hypothetical protein E3K37_01460 [Candidatus Kuenenia sp.]|nr:hypothetical protein [Candidatus Kuenenia hertensis]
MENNITTTLPEMLAQIFADEAETIESTENNSGISLSLALALTHKKRAMQKQYDMIRTWLEAERQKKEYREKFIDYILEQFMMNYFSETGSKTLALPNEFRLSLRKKSESVEIEDEQAAIKWALENERDEILKTEYLLRKKEIMAHVKATGELPPGVKINTGEGFSFSVKDQSDGKQ